MLERRWLLLTLYGILLASTVSEALKGARTKFKIATTSTTTTTTEEPNNDEKEKDNDSPETTTLSTDVNATTGHTLTGIPQIDYVWDPNLPRELNGYNLSDYPFYNSIPEEIDFKCDGLHDGFYASVPHKCQVYHHCLYGTRYDFLCANFTAFDQRTFICHFASEVDCANSKKYWHRNDALYKATTTAPPPTQATTTTTTARPTSTSVPIDGARPTRRRRPFRRRPAYDYYDDDYYDDEYERPRGRGGYDRRDEYDYEERKYMRRDRERDREFRDRERDYRERETPRRDSERSERPPRDERDPAAVGARERFHMRNNRRDPPRPIRDPGDEEIRPVRGRDEEVEEERRGDDRRYEKIPIKDDYDEETPTGPSGTPIGDSLVKPAAPIASVYARPRTPPKIRRPVPLAEQNKFAYKATSAQPPAGESRKRPTESPPLDDEYYDEELEEIRPRRPPMRPRRPFRERERERTFYDPPRETRERDRDRPFRSRYRGSDDDEERPRKYPERSRDRYYERSRDRALDRGKDRSPDRDSRPITRRPIEKDDQDRAIARGKDAEPPEESRKHLPKVQDPPTTPTPTPPPPKSPEIPEKQYEDEDYPSRSPPPPEKPIFPSKSSKKPDDEYADDYYDEPEGPPSPPPQRTAVRIVKRPFLPSRGGNPNPRGLSPVGSKAPDARKLPEKSLDDREDGKFEGQDPQKRREFDRKGGRRPEGGEDTQMIAPEEDESERKPDVPWDAEEIPRGTENSNFGGIYTTDSIRDAPSGPGKQRINEVTHRLQDIPESEYDVTLNEALTPGFNQESSLPSGFVLPIHRQQLNREPLIQSSETNYKISRPYSAQSSQKPFVPSQQFVQMTRVGGNERSGSVQYFRTPEAANPGNQFRGTARSSWVDYGGF